MEETPASPTAGSLGSAVLPCANCGEETVHRILRLDRPGRGAVSGVARCRACRWTHRFVSARSPTTTVDLIVSRGAASERREVELPRLATLRVGELLPGVQPPVRLRKLDRRDGRAGTASPAHEVRTAWATADVPAQLRVAILQGARSSTERIPMTPGLRLEVGGSLRLPSGPVEIVALRAHQRTWRRPGDAFAAEEVRVVYGRRAVTPPAGRSPWRRERGTPSSRARSISRDARSRSSPGVSRNRTVPRARIAVAGATARNSSPS